MSPRWLPVVALSAALIWGCAGEQDEEIAAVQAPAADAAADAANSADPGPKYVLRDAADPDPGPTHDPDPGPGPPTPDANGGSAADTAGGFAADSAPTLEHPPEHPGPFPVGFAKIETSDVSLLPPRTLVVGVWYPSSPAGTRTRHMMVIEAGSHSTAPADDTGAPYPLVMFSHGNKGIHFQSFSIFEHLASHGFVVAAPDHLNNTLYDDPDDEETAAVALRRPGEMMSAMSAVLADGRFSALTGGGAVRGISGHSFGGFTTLLLAGGEVDVSAAQARCAEGVPGDVFCPSIPHWPGGETVTRPAEAETFEAALAMAPGGYAAFGEDGLAVIDIPVFLMGGTKDEYTANDIEPTYAALSPPRFKLIVDRGGHMMFTDICRIPFVSSIPTLGDLCDTAVHISIDRGLQIVNTYAAAFFRYYLKDDAAMLPYLDGTPVVAFPEADLEAEVL